MKLKSRNMSSNTPLRIWIMAGASSIALAALVVTLSTRTVHANAPLSRPTDTVAAPPPIAVPAPDSLAAQRKAIKRGDRLHGIASWYGKGFDGRTTASGERFDMFAMTACHPTLPFGSVVRVVNHNNKHSVIVKITDRGDLVEEGRIIDLSFAAAQKLAMTKAGLASVDLVVLSLGKSSRNQ